jgi:hypothetical protein
VILGAVAICTTVTALLGTRRLFTPDHRLVPVGRSAQDEG